MEPSPSLAIPSPSTSDDAGGGGYVAFTLNDEDAGYDLLSPASTDPSGPGAVDDEDDGYELCDAEIEVEWAESSTTTPAEPPPPPPVHFSPVISATSSILLLCLSNFFRTHKN